MSFRIATEHPRPKDRTVKKRTKANKSPTSRLRKAPRVPGKGLIVTAKQRTEIGSKYFAGSVHWVRSADHHVYLMANVGGRSYNGWAYIEDAFTFGIMAASSASGKLLNFFSDSHDPEYGDGAGMFYGIHWVEFMPTD